MDRDVIESLHDFQKEECQKHREKIRFASQKLEEQITLANASQNCKSLEVLLAQVFESDMASIEYLTTFHTVFGMALRHTKMFSEQVNVNIKRTRLLTRALHEIVEHGSTRPQEVAVEQLRSSSSPNPINVFLGSSDDDNDERTEPKKRRLDRIYENDGDIVINAMKTARITLHQAQQRPEDQQQFDSRPSSFIEALTMDDDIRERDAATLHEGPPLFQQQLTSTSSWKNQVIGFLALTGRIDESSTL
jgi:hypothetical protein